MQPLLYLAPVAWHDLWQRPQRLAQALADTYDLTYCNPVGMRSVRWSDWRRLVASQRPSLEAPALPIFRPRYLPWQGAPFDGVNRRWLARQVRRAIPAIDGRDLLLWIGAPSLLALTILETFQPAHVVYDCMDHFAGFHGGAAGRRIEAAEKAVLNRADQVFATSRPLRDELSRRHPHVILAPNGVDAAHFSSVPRKGISPEVVIGFHGTLGEWLDFELIESLAAARPNWRWEFVGPIAARGARRIFLMPNIRHTPAAKYQELPAHLARFDVGIIPFVRNRLTDAAHPVKLGEFLAAGVPVVATRLDALTAVPGHVDLAETQGEWLAALDAAVAPERHSASAVADRRMLAAMHSWRRTAEIVLAALRKLRETPQRNAFAPPNSYRPAA